MPGRSLLREEHVFLVRMWEEKDAYGRVQHRSSITHVLSGERRYFTSATELAGFLETWSRPDRTA